MCNLHWTSRYRLYILWYRITPIQRRNYWKVHYLQSTWPSETSSRWMQALRTSVCHLLLYEPQRMPHMQQHFLLDYCQNLHNLYGPRNSTVRCQLPHMWSIVQLVSVIKSSHLYQLQFSKVFISWLNMWRLYSARLLSIRRRFMSAMHNALFVLHCFINLLVLHIFSLSVRLYLYPQDYSY